MKNQLFIVLVEEDSTGSLPKWEAVFTSNDNKAAEEAYKAQEKAKLLILWNITKGASIIRADLGSFQMSPDWSNLDVPYDNLANWHRAGSYQALYNAIVSYITS